MFYTKYYHHSQKINIKKFCKCPRCYGETKHIQIRENDLSFGEVLHKEINKKR